MSQLKTGESLAGDIAYLTAVAAEKSYTLKTQDVFALGYALGRNGETTLLDGEGKIRQGALQALLDYDTAGDPVRIETTIMDPIVGAEITSYPQSNPKYSGGDAIGDPAPEGDGDQGGGGQGGGGAI